MEHDSRAYLWKVCEAAWMIMFMLAMAQVVAVDSFGRNFCLNIPKIG